MQHENSTQRHTLCENNRKTHSISENGGQKHTMSENGAQRQTLCENCEQRHAISENVVKRQTCTVSENDVQRHTLSGNNRQKHAKSENSVQRHENNGQKHVISESSVQRATLTKNGATRHTCTLMKNNVDIHVPTVTENGAEIQNMSEKCSKIQTLSSNSGRNSCPLGCGIFVDLHEHVCVSHFPLPLWILRGQQLLSWQHENILEILSKWILGRRDLHGLETHCKTLGIPAYQHKLSVCYVMAARALTSLLISKGHDISPLTINKYKLLPLMSQAFLIHWRVIVSLLPLLSEEQRKEFKSIETDAGLVTDEQREVEWKNRSTTPTTQVVDVKLGSMKSDLSTSADFQVKDISSSSNNAIEFGSVTYEHFKNPTGALERNNAQKFDNVPSDVTPKLVKNPTNYLNNKNKNDDLNFKNNSTRNSPNDAIQFGSVTSELFSVPAGYTRNNALKFDTVCSGVPPELVKNPTNSLDKKRNNKDDFNLKNHSTRNSFTPKDAIQLQFGSVTSDLFSVPAGYTWNNVQKFDTVPSGLPPTCKLVKNPTNSLDNKNKNDDSNFKNSSTRNPCAPNDDIQFGSVTAELLKKQTGTDNINKNMMSHETTKRFNIIEKVASFNDIRTFPLISCYISSSRKMVIGLRAEHAQEFAACREQLVQNMHHSNVVAVGTIELNHNLPASKWDQQEKVFEKLLLIAAKHNKAVILKLRGNKLCTSETDVHSMAILAIKELFEPSHFIQIQSLSGDQKNLKRWVNNFENCYFDIEHSPTGTNEKKIVSEIPLNRLLLGTEKFDFCHDTGQICNTDFELHIGEIAKEVAMVKSVSIMEVMETVLLNIQKFYGIQPRFEAV